MAQNWSNISNSGHGFMLNGHVKGNFEYHQQRPWDEQKRDTERDNHLVSAAASGDDGRLSKLIAQGGDIHHPNALGLTAIHLAAFGGSPRTIQMLVKKDADINCSHETFGTPLCLAAIRGRLENFKTLLNYGAKLFPEGGLLGSVAHAACAGGHLGIIAVLAERRMSFAMYRTVHFDLMQQLIRSGTISLSTQATIAVALCQPLHVAANFGRKQCIQQMMNLRLISGVDAIFKMDLIDDSGKNLEQHKNWTALFAAVRIGHDACARVLLQAGARVHHRDDRGETAAYVAVRKDLIICLQTLDREYHTMGMKNSNRETPLHVAVKQKKVRCIQFLVDTCDGEERERDDEGRTALHYAARIGDRNCLAACARNSQALNDRDRNGLTAIYYASKNQDPTILQTLVGMGANINSPIGDRGATVLADAAFQGDLKRVKLLKRFGASLEARDFGGETPLHKSIWDDKADVARTLLELGANPNCTNKCGVTPLRVAINQDNKKLVRMLISRGASPNMKDKDTGYTPIMIAAFTGKAEILSILINSKGANLNEVDKCGMTALHYAAKAGNTACISVLCGSGRVRIHQRNGLGRTAIMFAAWNGHADAVKELISRNANVNEKGPNGYTTLQWARKQGRDKVVRVLEKHTASSSSSNVSRQSRRQ